MIVPVVLAGGVGSRLWPQSRALLPKQFTRFPQQSMTLFQNTLVRLDGLKGLADPIILCNEEHRFLVAEQVRELDHSSCKILLEPIGRNTAPAIAMAALEVVETNPDAVLLVLPADHVISDTEEFHRIIARGNTLALSGKLITFGIVPGAPETGYGYIRKGDALEFDGSFQVAGFVEKPDLVTATAYLRTQEYLWNSGMFVFQASSYLSELAIHAPDMLEICRSAHAVMIRDADYARIPHELFASCPSDSIDYAVMEKTDKAAVIGLDANWNDLGSWNSLWNIASKDGNNNAVYGDVLLESVKDSYIQADSRLVAVAGVHDLVIVETTDAVLIADKKRIQDVKKLVENLERENRKETKHHDKVYRPWGSYQSLANEDGYQVKHIVVKPGAALSLQMHHHRSEHWTVIRGNAKVTRDNDVVTLKANESIFLPLGCKHRLENPSSHAVEIIEVQVGDYLGEDDIVRFEDVYGRME